VAKQPEIVEFDADAAGGIVAMMEGIAVTGKGWINFQPAVDPDDVPDGGGAFRVFSVRGPTVPLCTWLPADRGTRGTPYVSLGVQHGAGRRVAAQLAEAGAGVPSDWRVLQDNPKKGIVVAAPPDADAVRLLEWLLDAGRALCPVEYRRWRAVVHRR
jgi:hypothetical protein